MLAPVLLLLVLLIKLTSRGPAIFVQRRIGLNALEFDMYKLRTMVDGADKLEEELSEQNGGRTFLKILTDPLTTRVGRLLRKYSLDELPQLYNVLRGDMSLVGPRPLLRCEFSKFPRSTQMRRFIAKPGLTGLWQVSGRSACSDEERIRLDPVLRRPLECLDGHEDLGPDYSRGLWSRGGRVGSHPLTVSQPVRRRPIA